MCEKGIAVVALFAGVVGLVEVLKRSYSVTSSWGGVLKLVGWGGSFFMQTMLAGWVAGSITV